MSLSSHVQELKKKHKSLSSAVEHAQQAPSSNTLRIMELKKTKIASQGRNYSLGR